MNPILALLLQNATPAEEAEGWWQAVLDFIDTPAPYSPFSEYLLVLFVLWLLARYDAARQGRKRSLEQQAQQVLEEKFEKGELTKDAFDKFRQDVSMTPRR